MIYTDMTKKAMKIMVRQHKDQLDKSGLPYILHPWLVAEWQNDEVRTTVALLHDVVEDTNMTFDDLKKEGFSDEVIDAIKLLTHEDEYDNEKYIKSIATNPIAIDVKLADLKHNMDLSRIKNPTANDYERVSKRYEPAYQKILNKLEQKEK